MIKVGKISIASDVASVQLSKIKYPTGQCISSSTNVYTMLFLHSNTASHFPYGPVNFGPGPSPFAVLTALMTLACKIRVSVATLII
jgi:hypothetical protein